MRRTVSIILAILLCAALIVSCDADKAGGNTPQPGPSANMTESYRIGRDKFHFVTDIWLPELEGVELLGSSDFSTSFGTFAEALFDILGDKPLYDSIAAYLERVLGNPTNKDDYGQAWSLERTVDDKDYEGSVFMMFDNNDPNHTAIYINCVLGMKQNYKTYRTLLHEATGIWLPESQSAQILETSEITKGDTRVQFNINLAYDATLFTGIVSALKSALPKDPLMDVEDIALWEYLLDKDGSAKESPSGESANTAAKINWQVEKSTDEKTNPIISFLFLQRNYFTVSLVAQTGGSVQMMASGKPVEGNTFRGTDDWNLELTATPEEGYVFTGWYRDDRKIASSSTYNYSPRDDETITAHFEVNNAQ